MKILLSAGHGGTDSGSIGADKGKEKDRTINLANTVATILRNAGHTVTVEQEKTASGAWTFKNDSGYDYSLSIHFNAFNGTATGTECLYKTSLGKATEMSKAVANAMGIKNRGAKQRTDLYMLNIGFDNLIEVCFHDNRADLNKYISNINKVANAIASTIMGGVTPTPAPTPSNPDYTGDITYQSYDNVKKQWLPEVVNDKDYAGNLGNGLGGLRAKPKYGEIFIQTHTLGGSWLSTISSKNYKKNDKTNGNTYSGIYGKKIDGVKIWSTKGYVSYRAHLKNGKWLSWVHKADNTSEGYAGIYGKEIDAIQMK